MNCIVILSLIAVCLSTDIDFEMQFTGYCAFTSATSYYCMMKGPTQTASTVITAQDAVKFNVKTQLGLSATMNIGGDFNKMPSEWGNITFGSPLFHNHAFTFTKTPGAGTLNNTVLSDTGPITGGVGQFAGMDGVIASSCRSAPITPTPYPVSCFVSVISTVP